MEIALFRPDTDRFAVSQLARATYGYIPPLFHDEVSVFVCRDDQNRVIGFDFCLSVDYASLVDLIGVERVLSLPVEVVAAAQSSSLCIQQFVCVAPEFRGQGIASRIVHRRLRWAQTQGFSCFISVAWQRQDGRIRLQHVLTRLGFTLLLPVPGFWSVYSCVDCGSECGCVAFLYFSLLD